MKVAFYKGREYGNLYNQVISYWLSGNFTHVELWTNEGKRYSADPIDGVVCKTGNVDLEEWEVVDLSYRFPNAEYNANQLLGSKYDYLGVYGFVFRPARGKESRWFCSEFIAHCLGFKEPWRYDPSLLYDILSNNQL